MDKKDTRGVNVENVIKLIKYLKKENRDNQQKNEHIDNDITKNWSLEKWIVYDNKCEW